MTKRSVVPREIRINFEEAQVSWNAAKTRVAAKITENSISRLTREIRISNPSELDRWTDYRKKMVAALMAQGKSGCPGSSGIDDAK